MEQMAFVLSQIMSCKENVRVCGPLQGVTDRLESSYILFANAGASPGKIGCATNSVWPITGRD